MRIMVLEHGRIIERGTHEELLKLKGTVLSVVYRKTRIVIIVRDGYKPCVKEEEIPREKRLHFSLGILVIWNRGNYHIYYISISVTFAILTSEYSITISPSLKIRFPFGIMTLSLRFTSTITECLEISQITDPLPVPWIILLQDDLFETDMLLILEGLCSQHQYIIHTQDEISFRYECPMIAQHDCNDKHVRADGAGQYFFSPRDPGLSDGS